MTATGTRNVRGYTRRDGTHVHSYSQRYQKGDARAVAGGLAVSMAALLVATFHLFTALLTLVAVIAGALAVLIGARAEVRRRRNRANARRRRGKYMLVAAWRKHRAKRPPAKRRHTTSSAGRSAPWGSRKAPWGKSAPWKSRAGHRVNRDGSYVMGPGGRWIKETEGSSRNTGR